MNPLYAAMPITIFEEMSGLARQHTAINLGQGFPDRDGALDIRQAAADALLTRSNQYPPSRGLPELREAVAAHEQRFYGIEGRAEDVTITSGATEAIAASLLALISPGDEVLLIQPMYDAYLPLVRQAGGVPRFLTLRPPEWRLTADAIAAAITPATRLVVLNNPVNPAARLFTRQELGALAAACVAHDLIAVSDEVWEHVVFDGRAHIPLSTLPGMAARTVRIGSAGKIFSLTGWKIGFIVAPPALGEAIARAHQFLTFTTPPALQTAVAYGLGKEEGAFTEMRAGYQRARDLLAGALSAEGFAVLPSEGTYFLNVDLVASGIAERDADFCRRIVTTAGVAAIPLSAFYAEDAVDTVIRLCFAKQDDVLLTAAERLGRARRVSS